MVKRFYFIFILLLLSFNLSSAPGKVRMISIGIDYKNSDDESLSLDGTLNDAYEMASAFGSIMEAKGVEFEPVVMVQEGDADYIIETVIKADKNYEKLLKSVRKAYSKVSKNSYGYYEFERDDGSIVVRDSIRDMDKVDKLIDKVEAIKTKDGETVDIRYFDIKDTYLYPTSENILNEVLRAEDLASDDLLIIYFSGHGGEFNAFTYDDMDKLLTSFIEEGKLTEFDKSIVLENESCYITDRVLEELCRLDVDSDTIMEVYDRMEASEDSYATGILSTAISADDIFASSGSLEMLELYVYLSFLKCDSVLILDACHSGYASLGLSEFIDESDYDHAVNIAVISSSASEEESSEVTIETEDGYEENHGAFTAEILSHLGWVHSSVKTTELIVPFFTAAEDNGIEAYDQIAIVPGYLKTVPERQTASEFYEAVISDWSDNAQSPDADDSAYLLYLIP